MNILKKNKRLLKILESFHQNNSVDIYIFSATELEKSNSLFSIIPKEKCNLFFLDKNTKFKNIAIVSPDYLISGGIYAIYTLAKELSESFNVTIITTQSYKHPLNQEWPTPVRSFNYVQNRKNIQTYDALILTWLETFFWSSNIHAKQFIWFIQSLEHLFYHPTEEKIKRIIATIPYYIRKINYLTISPWIAAELSSQYGIKCELLPNTLPNNVNFEEIAKERAWQNKQDIKDYSVLVEGSSTSSFKNLEEAIDIANKISFYSKTIIIGGEIPEKLHENLIKNGWKIFNNVSRNRAIEEYSNSDILLKTTKLDSFGFPMLEMMATKGLVMTKPYQGAPGLCEHEYNCIIFDTYEDIVNALVKNIETRGEYFKNIASNGYEHAKKFFYKDEKIYTKHIENIIHSDSAHEEYAVSILLQAVKAYYQESITDDITSINELKKTNRENFNANQENKPLRYKLVDYILFVFIKKVIPEKLYDRIKQIIIRGIKVCKKY